MKCNYVDISGEPQVFFTFYFLVYGRVFDLV